MKKPKQPNRLIRRLVIVTLAIAAGSLPMLMPQWMTSLAAYGYNPGYFQLSAYGYQVNENNGPAIITVQRTGGSDGVVSVDCSTSDATATAGFDYIATLITLWWADGDASDKPCPVEIIDDNVPESDEEFYVSIGNPTGGAGLGSPDTATVTIHDDDGPIKNDVIIDFGPPSGMPSSGIHTYLNNSTWAALHPLSQESMVTGDLDATGKDEVIIDFGAPYGIWKWMNNNNWIKLHPLSPESMVTGDIDGSGQDDVVIDFGAAYGIWKWMNNNTWEPLHPSSPDSMVTGDIDGSGQEDVIIDFGAAYGIWKWMNNSNWNQLHPLSPDSMVTGDIDGSGQDDVIIDFGAPYGIWKWMNNSNWNQLHPLSPDSMVTGDLDGNGKDEVIIDFGAPYGFWIWMNNSTWVPFVNSANLMVTGDIDTSGQDDVIVSFEGFGIWAWMNNNNWIKLHNQPAQGMVTGNIDGIPSLAVTNATMMMTTLPAELENTTQLPK